LFPVNSNMPEGGTFRIIPRYTASSRRQYPFHLIEPKWQQAWDEREKFRAFNPGETIPAQSSYDELATHSPNEKSAKSSG
jgi:hypothetical protein